jgi:hypothetical protein
MANINPRLEALFDKVRALPEPQQAAVAETLAEITDGTYQLSASEIALLMPELEAANRREFASRDTVDAVLTTVWTKAAQSR